MSSQYLHIVTKDQDVPAMPAEPALVTKYEPDRFQKFAVKAIEAGDNVFCIARTGSGKTFIGEYQIAHSLRRGGRVFYTTPIKSLSNQKFYDLKQMFPDRVGIMTGDIKFKPDADIVIMTTEILRNLLFKRGSATEHLGITAALSLDRLDAVVFDECHYINDKDRGAVWEETLILLPPKINLVLLSATIDGPEAFGAWLGDLKQKPIHLISTEYRIVPLVHGVYKEDEFMPVMDHRDVFDSATYNAWLRWHSQQDREHDQHRQRVADRRRGGYEDAVVSGGSSKKSFIHEMNTMIARLEAKELLPALFFVFSRKDCERYAAAVEHTLINSSETAALKHIMDFHLHRYGDELLQMPQYHAIRSLLEKGIAFHHSGLLPILKEIVEILFGRGFIKVLFATETFAVGINMPTKSVVFTGFRKFDDSAGGAGGGQRMLTTDEYIQMAGRAGRRGKDVRGSVIYLPAKEPESLANVKLMMTGPRTTFQSRMTFYYDFLLKTLQTGNVRWIDVMKNSYWSCKQDQRVVACRRELAGVETALKACELTPAQIADMEEFDVLAAAVKGTGNAERKAAQRALEGWKQRHMGPVWWKIEKELWRKYTGLQRDRAAICDDIERLVAGAEDDVDRTLSALEGFGFFDKRTGALTPAGVVASEVNEGHPILMSMFYTGYRDLLKTREEVLAFLAHFLPHSKDEGYGAVPPTAGLAAGRKALETLATSAEQIEHWVGVISPRADYWTIHTFYVEIIWRLVNGEAPIGQLCADYGLFEGNIIRILSSMLHLLEEWRNMATLSNDTQTLEMLVDAETLISPAGSVCTNGESIYLRL